MHLSKMTVQEAIMETQRKGPQGQSHQYFAKDTGDLHGHQRVRCKGVMGEGA